MDEEGKKERCPGMEKCVSREVEASCEGCTRIPEPAPEGWEMVKHIMALREMRQSGCRFHIDELTPLEWLYLGELDSILRKFNAES